MLVAVIDDDVAILNTVAAMLRQMQCRTCVFSDPIAAMNAIPADADLILSDIGMLGMDGFAVADRVASQFGTSPPKMLLMSGNDLHKHVHLENNILFLKAAQLDGA